MNLASEVVSPPSPCCTAHHIWFFTYLARSQGLKQSGVTLELTISIWFTVRFVFISRWHKSIMSYGRKLMHFFGLSIFDTIRESDTNTTRSYKVWVYVKRVRVINGLTSLWHVYKRVNSQVDPLTRLASCIGFGLAGQLNRPEPDTITHFANPFLYSTDRRQKK